MGHIANFSRNNRLGSKNDWDAGGMERDKSSPGLGRWVVSCCWITAKVVENRYVESLHGGTLIDVLMVTPSREMTKMPRRLLIAVGYRAEAAG